MPRYKVTDAGRRPACDRLDIVSQTIITVGGMEVGHRHQVLEEMVRQIAAAKLLVPLFFQWHIDIGDGSTECV